MSESPSRGAAAVKSLPIFDVPLLEQPALQLIYDTAPIGLAVLSPDCRYLQLNQRLTEICGISVEDHLGRSVRDCVPALADAVEGIVRSIMSTGEPVAGIEVTSQRMDKTEDRRWVTYWHPLRDPKGEIIGVNVAAEEITERKRAEAVLAANDQALRESETRLRELADNISQFAWTADAKGWVYWYNKRWHDYAGTTLEDMQGWGWQKVHHPEHVDRVIQRSRESYENGTPWEDTFPLRSKDGTYRWFLSRALPIRNEAGEVVRWFGTNTDVTEQIEAENALRELNATLEQRVEAEAQERLQIWNVSQDLLVVADLEGKYLNVNPAWTATLGWSEADLLDRSSRWLLHPDDQEKTHAEIRHLAAGGKSVRFESRFRHRDGSYRWISWKAVPDRGRLYAMGRDITELKDTENELREARRELALATRRATLDAMSAAIAHEIRQPLAAILANALAGSRFLSMTPPNFDEARDVFKVIAADVNRADEVIQSVRAMYSQSNQIVTPLDVNELIRQTIALVRGEFEVARIAIQLELASQLPLISAHRVQLQQVVLNVVTNAADAMRTVTDRARVLRIESGVSQSNSVEVTIKDSGTGIEPENIDHIFDAFFTTKTNGMGIGLAICRSIVEAHGGTLTASARAPHGSVFRIALPNNR